MFVVFRGGKGEFKDGGGRGAYCELEVQVKNQLR